MVWKSICLIEHFRGDLTVVPYAFERLSQECVLHFACRDDGGESWLPIHRCNLDIRVLVERSGKFSLEFELDGGLTAFAMEDK
jgi:hypothetical protein